MNLNGNNVNFQLGILLVLIAGTLNGMFALPMKLNKNWTWENNWSSFSLLFCGIIIYGGSLLFGISIGREYEYHRSSITSHYLQS